jgi:hypothetical protein
MYACNLTLAIAILLVSCNTPTQNNNKVPNNGKPIPAYKTDIIKTEFPEVEYVE